MNQNCFKTHMFKVLLCLSQNSVKESSYKGWDIACMAISLTVMLQWSKYNNKNNFKNMHNFVTFMHSYYDLCPILYILFSSCQLALFGYPDCGFSVLFLSFKANARV